jgi:hypothetical protein
MKHHVGLVIGLMSITAVVAAMVFRLPAEIMVHSELVSAVRPAFGLQPISVQADDRIFTLFTARNACGFDCEFVGMSMHPVRQKIRAVMAGKVMPSRGKLCAILG